MIRQSISETKAKDKELEKMPTGVDVATVLLPALITTPSSPPETADDTCEKMPNEAEVVAVAEAVKVSDDDMESGSISKESNQQCEGSSLDKDDDDDTASMVSSITCMMNFSICLLYIGACYSF